MLQSLDCRHPQRWDPNFVSWTTPPGSPRRHGSRPWCCSPNPGPSWPRSCTRLPWCRGWSETRRSRDRQTSLGLCPDLLVSSLTQQSTDLALPVAMRLKRSSRILSLSTRSRALLLTASEFFWIIIDFVVSNKSGIDLDPICGRHSWQLDSAGVFLSVHHHLDGSGVVAGDNWDRYMPSENEILQIRIKSISI